MTREPETSDQDDTPRADVEGRILDDDRRRSGEFLRDFLSRHRVEPPSEPAEARPDTTTLRNDDGT